MPVLSIACVFDDISAFPFLSSTRLVIALSVALVVSYPAASAQTVVPLLATYAFTDLGTLSGAKPTDSTYGYAINASGDGSASTSDEQVHAVIFMEGMVKDLGVFPAPIPTVGSGINGYDEVTGYLKFLAAGSVTGTYTHAFLYSAGRMKDIGTLPDDVSYRASKCLFSSCGCPAPAERSLDRRETCLHCGD
jgi:uncharacterized membrane protein